MNLPFNHGRFYCNSTRMVGHSIATVCIVITNSDCVWLPYCHSRPLCVSSQNWKYLNHSSGSSDSEFIWPSGLTRPAPPLPVGFVGVLEGSGSGAFIACSSSLQGIAKKQITQLKCGTGNGCDLQVSRYRHAGRLTESVRSPSSTGLRVSN